MENEIKVCQYKNCQKSIPDNMRKDAKFCCRAHKNSERRRIKNKLKIIQENNKGTQ